MATKLKTDIDSAETAAFIQAVEEGRKAADAGQTLRYDAVRRWVLSWGSNDELASPRKS